MHKTLKLLTYILLLIIPLRAMATALPNNLPNGFAYLNDVDPSIVLDIKYAGHDNFLGRPVPGYRAPQCITTLPAARALAHVQAELKTQGLGLKVFDCYRPQMAVDEFVRWSQDLTDQKMKAQFYPRVNKADLFKLEYISARSGHTRGSTVDLTLIKLTGANRLSELDMGTPFDFLDERSHPLNQEISGAAYANRMQLRAIMQKHGFEPWHTEWWHFTLSEEPFKETYFNFPVA